MSARGASLADPASDPSVLLYRALRRSGVDFFVSVPCKLLDGLIRTLEGADDVIYTPVTREEEGLGILAGAWLAGRRPAIVMQNSGFGNSINAVQSLLRYYRIPVVFVVSHRGSEGEPIEAQYNMGGVTKDLLRVNGIDTFEIGRPGELATFDSAIPAAFARQVPVAFLFPFAFWTAQPPVAAEATRVTTP